MSDFWHKIGCCVAEKPQPKKKRRRIDRSMIGEPMNFIHLTHLGSGDMSNDGPMPGSPSSPVDRTAIEDPLEKTTTNNRIKSTEKALNEPLDKSS
ncbi:CDC42 small effector protein 1-A [Acipenser oxyrinchus oxyrinchus]|uniref:CDC42 small effector protein 1-A n=1 Tax=Acipenser oxyrinchus oxyrinchus TaxID=40147 RepID=A0AAD8CP39_ACIOX|nr:CDC42 small effector protein 1-A [Acipenser oxyrinchus oxyrinchus]